MSYFMGLKLEGKWEKVKPSGKKSLPYEYETFEEAERMLRTCYPLLLWNEEIKVIEEELCTK